MISGLSCLALNPLRFFFFPASLFPSFQLNRTMLETHCKEKEEEEEEKKGKKETQLHREIFTVRSIGKIRL